MASWEGVQAGYSDLVGEIVYTIRMCVSVTRIVSNSAYTYSEVLRYLNQSQILPNNSMADDYPRFLTILVLVISTTAGGLGVVLSSNPPPVLPGDAQLVDETRCTPEDVPENNVLTDEIISLSPGEQRQFSYDVPSNDSDIQVDTNTLAGMSPTVIFNDPANSTRISSEASTLSNEQVTTTQTGEYTLTLSNNNDFRSELDLEVIHLQCGN